MGIGEGLRGGEEEEAAVADSGCNSSSNGDRTQARNSVLIRRPGTRHLLAKQLLLLPR